MNITGKPGEPHRSGGAGGDRGERRDPESRFYQPAPAGRGGAAAGHPGSRPRPPAPDPDDDAHDRARDAPDGVFNGSGRRASRVAGGGADWGIGYGHGTDAVRGAGVILGGG